MLARYFLFLDFTYIKKGRQNLFSFFIAFVVPTILFWFQDKQLMYLFYMHVTNNNDEIADYCILQVKQVFGGYATNEFDF